MLTEFPDILHSVIRVFTNALLTKRQHRCPKSLNWNEKTEKSLLV